MDCFTDGKAIKLNYLSLFVAMLTTSATIVSIDYSPSREVVILHCKPEEIFVFQE